MTDEPAADEARKPAPATVGGTAPYRFLQARNALTYAGIAAALAASAMAGDPSRRGVVGQCLAAATLTDLFDGRFARMFGGGDLEKRFGVELDSLADALCFGFAPVLCVWRYGAPEGGLLSAAWLACALFYVLCAVTRLGYYNISTAEQSGFVGVPSTLFGIFWSGWLLFEPPPLATMAALVLGGLAMVSPIRLGRPGLRGLLVIVALAVGLLGAHAARAGSALLSRTPAQCTRT